MMVVGVKGARLKSQVSIADVWAPLGAGRDRSGLRPLRSPSKSELGQSVEMEEVPGRHHFFVTEGTQ